MRPIDGRSAERLTRNDNAEIVLSMPGASEEKIARILASFEATGRDEVILMSNSPLPPSKAATARWLEALAQSACSGSIAPCVSARNRWMRP